LAAAAREENGDTMSLFTRMPKIDHLLVVAAIGVAEKRTSGEIRVVIARRLAADPVAAARNEFERLGMTRTRQRNGVLIYLAPRSRTFAVIGDTAIHDRCGGPFWRDLAAAMTGHFQRGDFTGGLVHGINRAGALLAEHFPRTAGDQDELPNKVEETD